MPDPCLLLAGLGNPGKDYAATRHNAGFWLADALAERYAEGGKVEKFNSHFYTLNIGAVTVRLLKPQTFMNLSGKAVQAAMAFYKTPPEAVLAIHDEIDLPLGKIRLKQAGGDGGHNGLKSITAAVGPRYYRLRIGVGRPGRGSVSSHVLTSFAEDESQKLTDVCRFIAERAELLIYPEKHPLLMNRVAEKFPEPPKPKPEKKTDPKPDQIPPAPQE